MKAEIISSKNIEEKGDEETKIRTILNSDSPDLSVVEVRRNSQNKIIGKDIESDTIYYVLEGEGICLMNGKENPIKKGDLITVPKNTNYKNVGNIRLLAISIPKFNKQNQVYSK